MTSFALLDFHPHLVHHHTRALQLSRSRSLSLALSLSLSLSLPYGHIISTLFLPSGPLPAILFSSSPQDYSQSIF
jgi:hypothetical protein